MAQGIDIDREQLTVRLRTLFEDLAREVDHGFLPVTSRPDLEVAEQRTISRSRIVDLKHQMEANKYDGLIKHQATKLLGSAQNKLTRLDRHFAADVLHGVARAEIEQLRLMMFRLDDRLATYVPADPLFASPLESTGIVATEPVLASHGPSLSEVVDHHLRSGKGKWTAKTLVSKGRMLGYLVEHLGADRPIRSITSDDIRSFKLAISRLRSNHRAQKAQSFAAKQTDNEKLRIAPETVLNIYNPTRAFFAWATDVEGYLTVNPAEKIRIEVPKRVKGEKSRRPFTADELRQLFSAPVFTGCHSGRMLLKPGPLVLKEDHYWIPVMAYYTGARPGELVQLHLRDIFLEGPIPYIEITEVADKDTGSAPRKHVKSNAGVRKIPLHPDVLALGFGDFVARRRKMKKKCVRLFPRIKYGADGQASTVFSKWFARLLDGQGLVDPALTFHSLRHGMQDALRDALLPQYVIDRLFGHSSGTTAEEYGSGVSLEVLADAVRKAKLPLQLPHIL